MKHLFFAVAIFVVTVGQAQTFEFECTPGSGIVEPITGITFLETRSIESSKIALEGFIPIVKGFGNGDFWQSLEEGHTLIFYSDEDFENEVWREIIYKKVTANVPNHGTYRSLWMNTGPYDTAWLQNTIHYWPTLYVGNAGEL